jgi:hypothetical protein
MLFALGPGRVVRLWAGPSGVLMAGVGGRTVGWAYLGSGCRQRRRA